MRSAPLLVVGALVLVATGAQAFAALGEVKCGAVVAVVGRTIYECWWTDDDGCDFGEGIPGAAATIVEHTLAGHCKVLGTIDVPPKILS